MARRSHHPRPLGVSWSKLWAVGAVAAALPVVQAEAQTTATWTAATNFNWSNSANWNPLAVPGADTDVLFPRDPLTGFPNPTSAPDPNLITLPQGALANSLLFLNSYTLTGGNLTLTSGRVTVERNTSASIASLLTGDGSLTKDGQGTLYLTNSGNDYTGATNINTGALVVSNPGVLGSGVSPITIYGNTTRNNQTSGSLVFGSPTNSTALVVNREIVASGGGLNGDGFALQGFGDVVYDARITGNTSFGGFSTTSGAPITATGARLGSTSGTATVNGGLTAGVSGQFLTLGGTGSWVVNSTVDGPGGLEKVGTGLMILNATNTFGGNLQISGGFTRISSVGAMGPTTSTSGLNMNGGTLEIRVDGGLNANQKNVNMANSSTFVVDHAVEGSGINGTTTFKDLISNNRSMTVVGRNGYNLTFLNGNNNANSITDTLNFTNNGNGLLTLTGDLNATATSTDTIGFAGNGDILISGGTLKGAGAITHILQKSGTGILSITGASAGTYTGATNVIGGTLRINSFAQINATAGALNLGGNSTSADQPGVLDYRGALNTGAGETVTKSIALNGARTNSNGFILANQSGTAPTPLVINGTITSGTTTARTLVLGGTNTLDNEIASAIPNAGANALSLHKTGPGTWVLSNGSNQHTGGTTITEGLLKIVASGADSTVLPDAGAITFNTSNITGNQTAAGTLEFVAQSEGSVEVLGQLVPTAGAATIRITRPTGATGMAALQFGTGSTAGTGTYGTSASVNYVGPTDAANGTDYRFVLNNQATGFINGRTYFNSTDFAFYDASGYVRAPIYGADANFLLNTLAASNHSLLTSDASTGTLSIRSLKLDGSSAPVTLTVNSGGTLTVNNGGTPSTGGILTVGNATISGGTGITGGSGGLAFRVEGNDSVMTLATPITSGNTGGIQKIGAGTLILSGANSHTGANSITQGTLRLAGAGRLGAAGTGSTNALEIRQGATLDLNGISAGAGLFNGAGLVTNNGASPVTFTIGNGVATSSTAGVFSGVLQDGSAQLSLNVTSNSNSGVTSTFYLIGENTYTGSTTIGKTAAGTLVLAANRLADIGQPSSIGRGDVNNNAGSLIFNNGNLLYTGSNSVFQQAEQTPSVSTNRLFTMAGNATIDSSGQFGNVYLATGAANNATLIFSNTDAIAFSGSGDRLLTLQGNSQGDNEFRPLLTDNPNSGIVSFTKAGTGLWILGNLTNSYTGATTITGGALRVLNGATPGSSTLPANSPLVLNGGVLQTSGTFTRSLTDTPVNGTGTVSWNSGAAGGFAASTSKLTVNIGGNSTPSQLTWGSDGFVGGTLILGSTTSLADVELVNPIDLNGAVRTIQVDTNSTSTGDYATLSGALTGDTSSGLTKTGTGILRLWGNNTYGGDTTLSAGVIRVTSLGSTGSTSSSLGAGTGKLIITGSTTTAPLPTLSYAGEGEISNRQIQISGTSGDIVFDASGSGALVLTDIVNMATGTTAKRILLRGDSSAPNEIRAALTNNAGNTALNIQKDDTGYWILSGENTMSGTVVAASGTLGLGRDSTGTPGAVTSGALGTGLLRMANGTVLAVGGDRTFSNRLELSANASSNFAGNYSLTFNGEVVSTSTGGTSTVTNSMMALPGETQPVLTLGTTSGIFASVDTAARTLVFNGGGHTIFNPSIQNHATNAAGTFALTYSGYGSLTLNGVSTYSGATTLTSGTLRIGTTNALPSGTGKGNLTINPGVGISATLDLNGNSQAVNGITANSLGSIKIDNSGATAANFTFGLNDQAVVFNGEIANSGAGALSLIKSGTQAATFTSGPFSHKGSTIVNGGSLTLAGNVTNTTELQVGANSTLSLAGGLGAAANITKVIVGNGGTLSLFDGQGTPLSNLQVLQLGSGVTLSLNAGDTSDTLSVTGNALVTGAITLNIRDTGTMAGSQTYNLLTAGGGLISSGGTYTLNQIPGGFTNLTLNASDTAVTLTTGTLVTSSIYFSNAQGNGIWNAVDGQFNGLNFSKDKAGTTVSDFVPGAGTTVIFQADSVTGGGVLNTTLEQGFRIRALEFDASTNVANTPSAINIAPGANALNRLTIDPGVDNSTAGILMKDGGTPSVNISAPVGLGSNQTWTVTSANQTLSVTGPLSGAGTLAKAGAGKAILSGAVDSTFGGSAVSVDAGTLELTNATALGSTVFGNLAPVTVKSNGRFYYNNATAGTVANPITLSGGTLAAAGNSQTYSGNLNLLSESTVSLRDSGVTTTTTRTVTLSGVISGAGRMIVNSNPTISAGSAVSGSLVLSNASPSWSGGLLLQQGTVDLRQESSLGTGAVAVETGRVLFKGATNTSWNQFANGLLVDGATNAAAELQVDNQGTVGFFNVTVPGSITLGGSGAKPLLRTYLADALSGLELSGSIILKDNASIHASGSAVNNGTIVISGVISEQGGSRSLDLNGDTAWGSTNYQRIRLTAANTFSGPVLIGGGEIEFSTISAAGEASNLGKNIDAITLRGGTLRFIGNTTSVTTSRAMNLTANSGFSAAGTNGAKITYSGAINAANTDTTTGYTVTLTGNEGSQGAITGGITQVGTTADLIVNSGTWTLSGTNSKIADDINVNSTGAAVVLTLDSANAITITDDTVISGPGAVLNLNATGALNPLTPTGTSSGLYARAGAVININASDAYGTGLDFVLLGDSTSGAAGELNLNNSSSLTTPRLDLGQTSAGLEGTVGGNGTLIVNATTTDYATGLRLYRGAISNNITGNTTLIKSGAGDVLLSGDNSGLSGAVTVGTATTQTSTRIDAGTLILDFANNTAAKISSTNQLDMRGGTLEIRPNASQAVQQTVTGLTVGTGSNHIRVNGGAHGATLNLAALTRSVNTGTVRFEASGANALFTTTSPNVNGILGAFATIETSAGTFFAANSNGTGLGEIVPATPEDINDVALFGANANITETGSGFTGTSTGADINSLRFSVIPGSTVKVATGGRLTVASGGILVSSSVNGPAGISGGILSSGTNELIVTHNGGADFTVSSDIRDTTSITKTGAGRLVLAGRNGSTGALNILDGVVRLDGGSAISGSTLITLADDRETRLELGADETIGRLQGGSNASGYAFGLVDVGAYTLTINMTGGTTYAGRFTGTGTITKLGAGQSLNLTGASTGFTGTLNAESGLIQLSNIGSTGASQINLTRTGGLLLDNNGGTRTSARIPDATPINLNSAEGAGSGSTIPRGIWMRTDQNANTSETVGTLTFASGTNYFAGEASGGTSAVAAVIASDFVRTNNATANVRGRNLGGTSAERNQLRIGVAANETAFMAANLVGGSATSGTTQPIVPWVIGERATASLTDTNAGNSLVTYIAGRGFVPLDLANDYTTYAAAAGATTNVREVFTTGLSDLGGKAINALVLHNGNTATSNVAVTGTGSLTLNSGTMLFTANTAAANSSTHRVNLSGLSAIATSTGEYVFHVVNPTTAATSPQVTAAINSPLISDASITKSGRGTLVLSVFNTAGGGNATRRTTINEGTLEISDFDNIGGDTGVIAFAGGTLRLATGFADNNIQRTIQLLPGGGTIDHGDADITIASAVTGSGSLTKLGTGTLTFGVTPEYTGNSFFDNGTVIFPSNVTLASASFGTIGGNSTVQMPIPEGRTVTIGGNVIIGSNQAANTTTSLTASGGGQLIVNNPSDGGLFVIGGTTSTGSVGNRATADFSGLSSVTINLDPATGIVRVNPTNSNNTSGRFSDLFLPTAGAGNTTITANLLNIGDSAQLNGTAGQRNLVSLGSGLSTLNVNTVNIGTGGRDVGAIAFNNANGSIVLRAADGVSPANFNMGTGTATTGVNAAVDGNLFDVRGHQADIRLATVNIGTQATRTSSLTNVFSFDTGSLNIESLTMATKTTTGTGTTLSTMNLGGGTTTIGTGSGTAVTMATNTATGTAAANAVINITGGEVAIKGDVVKGAQGSAGSSSATINLNGGSLNMEGHNIGSSTASVQLNAEAGRLLNLGEYNGGGAVNKNGTGTLIMEGTNTYTGPTVVNAGTLELHGSLSGTTSLAIGLNATVRLQEANVVNNSADLNLNGGVFETGGFSEGGLSLEGVYSAGLGLLSVTANSVIDFGAGSGSQLLFAGVGNHTPGQTLSIMNWNGSDTASVFGDDRLLFAGKVEDFTSLFTQTDVSFNGTFGYNALQLDENYYVVTVPEPATTGLLAVASMLLGSARWRRRQTR